MNCLSFLESLRSVFLRTLGLRNWNLQNLIFLTIATEAIPRYSTAFSRAFSPTFFRIKAPETDRKILHKRVGWLADQFGVDDFLAGLYSIMVVSTRMRGRRQLFFPWKSVFDKIPLASWWFCSMTSSPGGFEWILLGSKVSSFDPYFEGWGRLKQQAKHGEICENPLPGRWCRLEPHHSQPRYSFWSMLESCQRSAGWGVLNFIVFLKCWMLDGVWGERSPAVHVSEATDRANLNLVHVWCVIFFIKKQYFVSG